MFYGIAASACSQFFVINWGPDDPETWFVTIYTIYNIIYKSINHTTTINKNEYIYIINCDVCI